MPLYQGEPSARFDDHRTGRAWQFPAPQRVITAHTPAEVLPALAEIETATQQGSWAYGFVCYEAARALDPALTTHDPDPGLPLLWFAITGAPSTPPPLSELTAGPYRLSPWSWEWNAAEHAERVAAVHEAIAAGDSYQCNLTTRLHAEFSGDPLNWYRALADVQRGGFHALLDIGSHTIVSASPECFFSWDSEGVTSVPMKGTAARSTDPSIDEQQRHRLLTSPKERAENVMIVDLIRNDLSRIAAPGTVRTSALLSCERYETVWQLTSSVTAQPKHATTLTDVFTALFPCGSITGAPKSSTTRLITTLEDSPRGVYCGAIGWVAPPTAPTRARFSVAIRTAVINNRTHQATYGVGGGITWASVAAAEWDELQAKARIVTDDRPGLIETFPVRDHQCPNLDLHLRRLRSSAIRLGIAVDDTALCDTVTRALGEPDCIARIQLHPDGRLDLATRPLIESSDPVRLVIDDRALPHDDPWRRHKTTRRAHFTEARQRHPDADDVILINDLGHLTETTIANLAVELDGRWVTPPLTDGLLPGIGRQQLLERGEIVEQSIPHERLAEATGLAVISSVRGWRPATLVSPAG